MNGDGGDESMAGDDRYLGSLLARRCRRIPRFARQWIVEPLAETGFREWEHEEEDIYEADPETP